MVSGLYYCDRIPNRKNQGWRCTGSRFHGLHFLPQRSPDSEVNQNCNLHLLQKYVAEVTHDPTGRRQNRWNQEAETVFKGVPLLTHSLQVSSTHQSVCLPMPPAEEQVCKHVSLRGEGRFSHSNLSASWTRKGR